MQRPVVGVAIAILFSVFLASCDGELTAEVYVRDILDLASAEQNQFITNATLAVESPGSDSIGDVRELIEQTFREARNFRTESRDFSTFLLADFKVPVRLEDAAAEDTHEDLFTVLVKPADGEEAEFGFVLDRVVFGRLQAYVEETYWQDLSIQDWDISVRLYNDTRGEITATLASVYVDQKPVPFPRAVEMSPRDALTLHLSDVLRDYGFARGKAFFGSLRVEAGRTEGSSS